MEELNVIREQIPDSDDPHGHFRDIQRQALNYSNSTKRCFLNECILQLHQMNGNTMPLISVPLEYNKTVMWHKLNNLIRPSEMTRHQILLQKIKRRLFLESRTRVRKCQNPQLNKSKLSDCVYFKALRFNVGIKKIPRNYLDQAKENIRNELRQKRKLTDAEDDEDSQQVVSGAYQYHGDMTRYHPEQERSMGKHPKRQRISKGYGVSRRAKKIEQMLIDQYYRKLYIVNERYLEASVRSFLYMKTLMRLILRQ